MQNTAEKCPWETNTAASVVDCPFKVWKIIAKKNNCILAVMNFYFVNYITNL